MNSGQGDCRDPGKHHKQVLAGYSQPSSALCTRSSLGCKELPCPSAEFLSLSILTPKCRTSSFQPSLQFISFPNNHGFSRWLSGKETTYQSGEIRDVGSILGLGRCPGGGNGNPLQYSCLEKSMDRGAWWASLWGCKESNMTERAGTCACAHIPTHTHTG